MNNKKDIEIKIEATLNSLEGIQTASPGAYFFTRVQARINRTQKSIWENISSFIARPAIALTVIVAVVLMNVVAVIQQKENSSSLAEQNEQSVYDDFNIAANTFYDYETSEP